MLIGVYWSFKFPKRLYSFDYFTYSGTVGGHGHSPSNLSLICRMENYDELIDELKQLIEKHQDGRIFIWRDNIYLKIVISAYELFDYDFCLAKEVERIIYLKSIDIVEYDFDFKKSKSLLRLIGSGRPLVDKRFNTVFQVVGSKFSQYDNQLMMLRYDCNVLKSESPKFIEEVRRIAKDEKINLAFYHERKVSNRYNLILLFGFGRQGLNLAPLIRINEGRLENRILDLRNDFTVEHGHYKINESDHYSKWYPDSNIRNDILMVDQEFIP